MLNYLTAMQAEGRLALAEAGFARILEQAPTHVHAWLGLGYCASLGGEPDIARRAFDTAASLGPQTDETALDCALALAHIGRTDAARSLLVARPESFGRQMALGALEESCGALAAAVGCYAAAHAADPAADQPLHRLVPLHRRLGDLATAHAMVDRLADLGPRQAVLAWHMRGILHASAGDRDAAIAAWRAGLACDPSCEAFTTDLAMALRQSCKVEEARAVLTARPPSYGILLALTELDLSLRDHAAALAHSAAAHALQPRRPEPLLRMARIEADRGNFAAARAAAERIEACCGAGHRRVMLRSLLATARIAGDARAALDSLRAMAALEPRDAGIAADLARQYRILGEPAAARQALRTALALDDQDQQALSEAVDQANLTDDRVGALAFAQRALAAAPDLAGQALRVARMLHDLDRTEEADAVLQAIERRFGRTADLWGETIRRLRDRGEPHEALREARAAQAAHPSHFGRWSERFSLELHLAPVAAVERCIALAPAQNRAEDAQVLAASARLAMRRREPLRAIAAFEAALALRPDDRGLLSDLFGLHLRALEIGQAAAYHARLAALEAQDRRMRRETVNASQSHHGQLLNDVLVDREALAELVAIGAAAPDARIPRFLAFIRRRPENIPGAMALLVALRQGGWLDRRGADTNVAGGRRLIPKRIVQFWDTEDPPADLLALSRSWPAQNPDHEHVLFHDRTALAYLAAHFPVPVAAAYRRARDATTKADLFRLAALLREGGIWADMDDRCLAPLPQLIPLGVAACFWQEGSGHLCNNFLAAMPGHPVLRRALTAAVTAINRGDRDKVWMLTGPGLLSRAFAAEMAAARHAWPAWISRNAVLDEYALYPAIAFHCRTSHKKQGKHWMKTAFAAAPGTAAKAVAA